VSLRKILASPVAAGSLARRREEFDDGYHPPAIAHPYLKVPIANPLRHRDWDGDRRLGDDGGDRRAPSDYRTGLSHHRIRHDDTLASVHRMVNVDTFLNEDSVVRVDERREHALELRDELHMEPAP